MKKILLFLFVCLLFGVQFLIAQPKCIYNPFYTPTFSNLLLDGGFENSPEFCQGTSSNCNLSAPSPWKCSFKIQGSSGFNTVDIFAGNNCPYKPLPGLPNSYPDAPFGCVPLPNGGPLPNEKYLGMSLGTPANNQYETFGQEFFQAGGLPSGDYSLFGFMSRTDPNDSDNDILFSIAVDFAAPTSGQIISIGDGRIQTTQTITLNTTDWTFFKIDFTVDPSFDGFTYIHIHGRRLITGSPGYIVLDDLYLEGQCEAYRDYSNVFVSDIPIISNIWNTTFFPSGELGLAGEIIVDQNLTIDGLNVNMTTADATFVVKPGVTLTIINSTISAFCGEMWEGIIVEDGGRVIVDNSNIYDARTAIKADGLNAHVQVDNNSFFERNKVHIHLTSLENFATLLFIPITQTWIRNSTFSHQQSLLDPALESQRVSIILDDCIFGNGNDIDSNTFSEKDGIRIFDSKVDITNNVFNNNHLYAIFADGQSTGNYREVNITNTNIFNQPRFSIHFQNGVSGTISGNTINHELNIDLPDIVIVNNMCTSCGKLIEVSANTINNHAFGSVYLQNNTGLVIDINNNIFNALLSSTQNPSAIYIIESSIATGFEDLNITLNQINNTKDGIKLINVSTNFVIPHISNNTISFSSGFTYLDKIGIDLLNCPGFEVENNTVTSNNNLQPTILGIWMADCGGSVVTNNTLNDLGIALLFHNDNTSLIPENNNINNCENSIVLYFNIFNANNLGDCLGSVNIPVDNNITNSLNADYVLINAPDVADVEDNINENCWYTNDICGGVDKYYTDGTHLPSLLTEVFPSGSILKKPNGTSTFCPVPIGPVLPSIPPPPVCELERFRAKYVVEIRVRKMGGITHAKDRLSKFVRQLVAIEEDIAHRDFIAAELKLPGLLPVCDLEEHIKEVLEIHVDQKKQHRSLTQAEKDTLINKAERSPHLLGQVVYTACAILKAEENLDFEDHIPVFGGNNNNARLAAPEITSSENNSSLENKIAFVHIYPNPAKDGKVSINYKLPKGTTGKIEFYDVKGQSLYVAPLNEGQNITDIRFSNFTNGVYIYKVYINSKLLQTSKLMME